MKIKVIISLLFVSVMSFTNINAQEQTYQQSSLVDKEWFLRFGDKPFYVKMVFTEAENIVTTYMEGYDTIVQVYSYYLSDNTVSVFDASEVGQSQIGKYIVTQYKYNNGNVSDQIKVFQIFYLSEDTYKEMFVGETHGDVRNTWHTSDWVKPYDWQSGYDNPYDDGDEHQGGGFHSDD